jgi:hypothetical protein
MGSHQLERDTGMSRKFVLEPTPALARQLMRLRDLRPDIVLDPEIAELAEVDVLRLGDAPGLTLEQAICVQELIDFEMRAIVIQPIGWKTKHPRSWLLPVLDAARRTGITDVVLSDQINSLEARALIENSDFTYHVFDTWGVLPEDTSIPRDALLIMPCVSTTTAPKAIVPLSLEFERTILIGDGISGNSAALYPNDRRLIDAFNQRGTQEWLENKTIRQIAFLFSTSYAISRTTT